MSYEDQIAGLLHAHLTKDATQSLPDLAKALGCVTRRTYGWESMEDPQQPDSAHEPLVVETLRAALRHHIGSNNDDSNGESILNGLLRNNRWRSCLESLDDAYAFVSVVACFYVNGGGGEMRTVVSDLQAFNVEPLKKALAEWFSLSDGEIEKMTMMRFLQLTFGELWCEFAIMDNMPLGQIIPLIYTMRPPFMEGLSSACPDIVACELPFLCSTPETP